MYYRSQQENENIWGFHQNDVINNKITQIFSDETSMSYRSQQENENIWRFHQNDVINNNITQIFSDECTKNMFMERTHLCFFIYCVN